MNSNILLRRKKIAIRKEEKPSDKFNPDVEKKHEIEQKEIMKMFEEYEKRNEELPDKYNGDDFIIKEKDEMTKDKFEKRLDEASGDRKEFYNKLKEEYQEENEHMNHERFMHKLNLLKNLTSNTKNHKEIKDATKKFHKEMNKELNKKAKKYDEIRKKLADL